MKSVFNQKSVGLAVALLCAATPSFALTLGLTRSVAILGQPLDLLIPVQTESTDASTSLCLEADVFYGDVRQDTGRVSLSVVASAVSPIVNVRVFSQNAVDEPVVTVHLRAGCDFKSTRRYVLLADLATDLNGTQGSKAFKVTPQDSRAVESIAVLPFAQNSSAKNGAVIASKPSSGEQRRSSKFGAPNASAREFELKKHPSVEARQRSRLKLAPLDLTIEQDPSLKISNELYLAPVEDLKKRAEAQALWRTLNLSLEDAMRDAARLETVGADLKDLRALTDKNQKSLVDLEVRLTEAQAAQYRNPLVYGLIFLLLVCGVTLLYVSIQWRGSRNKSEPWWRGNGATALKPNNIEQENARSPKGKGSGVDMTPSADRAAISSNIDIDLEQEEPIGQKSLQTKAKIETILPFQSGKPIQSKFGNSDFSHSVNTTLREIKTQEMIDATQQAEFFMTLGQHEEAIEVLVNSTQNSSESNPIVYLELLKVLHTLSRRTEYDLYRDKFNTLFSGRVPTYGHFHEGGDGLEAYVDVCNHISDLWPSSGAVEFIEHCLVREKNGSAVTFDLDAFRDLLTLHGTAKRIAASSNSDFLPFSTVSVQDAKLDFDFATSQRVTDPHQASEPQRTSASSARAIDIDVDLGL